jgi:hypothetical protein
MQRPRGRSWDLHPDGTRIAIAPLPEIAATEMHDEARARF